MVNCTIAANNITQILTLPNCATGGWFYVGILIALFFILLMIFIYNFEEAVIVSSLVTFLAALFMSYASLVSWNIALIFIAVFIFSILYVYLTSRMENVS